jgi:hypothetical protein
METLFHGHLLDKKDLKAQENQHHMQHKLQQMLLLQKL